MKIFSPLFGHLRGSAAGAIAQTYHGKTYLRTPAAVYHYPDTERQQETQGKFYDLQRAFLPVWHEIRQYATPAQRRSCNNFNEYASGLYRCLLTFQRSRDLGRKLSFGIDKRQLFKTRFAMRISAIFGNAFLFTMYAENTATAAAEGVTRVAAFMLNEATNEFYFTIVPYQDDNFTLRFVNSLGWQMGAFYPTYLAAIGKNGISNFYHVARNVSPFAGILPESDLKI